jgi:ribosomal protein S18 acetylase RimI-like enzyme
MITLENAPAVSVVSPAQEESALAPLVLAFANDPAARWLYPDPHQFRVCFPCFVRAFAGKAFALGTAQRIDGFHGAALWLPPGVAPDDTVLVPLIEETVAPERRAGVFAIFEMMGVLHPPEPHWYLPVIGIDPTHQGQGLGAALLDYTLATCDREGTDAYLEASNPRNVLFYERHGFEVRAEIQAGDSPTLFAMVRAPR